MTILTRRKTSIPDLLKKIFTDLKNPASFSSPLRLYRAARKINDWVHAKDVDEWLESQKSYTLHRRLKTKFPRRKVLTRGLLYQYQADLEGVM